MNLEWSQFDLTVKLLNLINAIALLKKRWSSVESRWHIVISPNSHSFKSSNSQKLNPLETCHWFFAFPSDSRWQRQQVALVKVETPPSLPFFSRHVDVEQVSTEERVRFGSWGPSSLFRHSLFSPSKNTSEAASLPAHGASEFHSILLSAAQSDLRSCLIYCTSR